MLEKMPVKDSLVPGYHPPAKGTVMLNVNGISKVSLVNRHASLRTLLNEPRPRAERTVELARSSTWRQLTDDLRKAVLRQRH